MVQTGTKGGPPPGLGGDTKEEFDGSGSASNKISTKYRKVPAKVRIDCEPPPGLGEESPASSRPANSSNTRNNRRNRTYHAGGGGRGGGGGGFEDPWSSAVDAAWWWHMAAMEAAMESQLAACTWPLYQSAWLQDRRMHSEGAQRQQRRREDPNRLESRRHPAKLRADDDQGGPKEPLEERTTIMLRNIPNNYSRDMLLQLLQSCGFGEKCNFVYLPMDFHTQSNLGYAFVNLEDADEAQRFWLAFEGFSKWAVHSKKVASLRWSQTQGLDSNIKRYRNSPVMADTVPDSHKPAVFEGGVRIDFPAPTKALRAPRT